MTIHSFTSDKTYETTDTDCTCLDFQYRGSKTGKPCKHQIARFVAIEAAKAVRFLELMARFDCRSQAVIEAKRAAYWNYEMAIAC